MQHAIDIQRREGSGGAEETRRQWHVHFLSGSLVAIYGRRNSLVPHLLQAIASRNISAVDGNGTISISMFGNNISDFSPNNYVKLVAYLPDDPDAFFANLYVDEEIGFYLENVAKSEAVICSSVDRTALELGISHLLPRKLASLSGGQKQLVAIAATLCTEADIILIEDPLANLDSENRLSVLQTLKRYSSKGKTVIFGELDWSEWALQCDQLVIFNETQLLYDGPPISGVRARHFDLPDSVERNDHFVGTASNNARIALSLASPLPKIARTLVINDLTFHYRDQRPTIDRAHIELSLDNIVGIVGKNGAGKSTFAKILSGLLAPSSGSVKFENFQCASNDIRVAYAFQNPKLQFLSDTVREEIWFPFRFIDIQNQPSRNLVEKLVAEFGLTDFIDQHPLQIPPLAQHKLVLAALMATEPHVLIIDEPSNGLDTIEKMKIADHIREIHRLGTAVFVISHDQKTLDSVADERIIIEDGKIYRNSGN